MKVLLIDFINLGKRFNKTFKLETDDSGYTIISYDDFKWGMLDLNLDYKLYLELAIQLAARNPSIILNPHP